MLKKSNILFALFVILALTLACATPLGESTTAEPSNVETIVAATFAALTASAPQADVTPQTPISSLLPHSIYFLNNDGVSATQLYRLEKDGKTVTQLTFESTDVSGYDVLPADGSVVFVSNNQLITINADGSNRSMIVDGGPSDPNDPILTEITTPLWSPDGETIAFGQKGINLYSIVSGQSTLTLPAPIDSQGFGLIYWPINYSPDGSKLMITVAPIAADGFYNAIYSPNGNTLTDLVFPNDARVSFCCSFQWTADSSYVYSGVSYLSPFTTTGLWRINASNGQVETLLSSDDVNEVYNLASSPFLGPDGQLYFVYANQTGLNNFKVVEPLQMVRSAPDGQTNRTVLRPESFDTANQLLWAPDASFLIAAFPPSPNIHQGGVAQLYYTDGQKEPIPLLPFAHTLKWGP